jgi:hypothetical protein
MQLKTEEVNRYRSTEMPCSSKISLAKPGDINMCKNIRRSWQKASQQLSGTSSGLESPEFWL